MDLSPWPYLSMSATSKNFSTAHQKFTTLYRSVVFPPEQVEAKAVQNDESPLIYRFALGF
jgi:hypothetical protein